jgi:hypothetical protein
VTLDARSCQYCCKTSIQDICTDLAFNHRFLPSKAEKLEFDLSIILFGIAYQRGLFVDELEVRFDLARCTRDIY